MYNPNDKLAEALGNAGPCADMALTARDRGEREFRKRMADLSTKIAQELESLDT